MNIDVERVHIDLADRGYDILIGAGILGRPESYEGLPTGAVAAIVSNGTVAPLHAQRLIGALKGRYAHVRLIELPDGEAHKDWPALNLIFDALLAQACDRQTVLFALGGGVIGDMTGFAAACYGATVPLVTTAATAPAGWPS